MKTLKSLMILAGLIALLSPLPGYSQATLQSTTLSAAATSNTNTFTVTSATGLAVGDLCFVDREAVRITAISSTTLTVRRGVDGAQSSHYSGAGIACDPPNWFLKGGEEKVGPCTAVNEPVLPVINVSNGRMWDCTGQTSSTQVWTEIGGPNGTYVQMSFCGDQPNNTTNYSSPIDGYPSGNAYTAGLTANDLSYALAGAGCDAEDSTTEATADEIGYANNPLYVLGMVCTSGNAGSNGTSFTFRAGAADVAPTVTLTIPTTLTTGAVNSRTTNRIAANSTLAVKQVSTEDLSATNFMCTARVQILP